MCLLLPCSTGFFDNLIVELLSHSIIVAPYCLNYNSSSILLSHMAWQAQAVAATNSAFVLDKVTIGCFFDDQEIAPVPRIKNIARSAPSIILISCIITVSITH